MITANDGDLNYIAFQKCDAFDNDYLFASRLKMLEWYNEYSKRGVCLSTLDRMIRRLVDAGWWFRKMRKWQDLAHGFKFRSSLTFLWNSALKGVKRRGVPAFEIWEEMKLRKASNKARPRREETRSDRGGSFTSLGQVVKEMVDEKKPI